MDKKDIQGKVDNLLEIKRHIEKKIKHCSKSVFICIMLFVTSLCVLGINVCMLFAFSTMWAVFGLNILQIGIWAYISGQSYLSAKHDLQNTERDYAELLSLIELGEMVAKDSRYIFDMGDKK